MYPSSLPSWPLHTQAEPEAIPLDVVYEDEDLLVVNKVWGGGHMGGEARGSLKHASLHCAVLMGVMAGSVPVTRACSAYHSCSLSAPCV